MNHQAPPNSQPLYAAGRLYFGGSFDPVHRGHVTLPPMIAPAIGAQQIIYVPAARSPHKAAKPTDDHHRLAMLTIALRDLPEAKIWTTELDRSIHHPDEPSYWADTWALVKKEYPLGANRFLIGADQASSMHRWRRFEEFWMYGVVVLRGGSKSVDALMGTLRETRAWSEQAIERWRSLVVETELMDVSSSEIRSALADPQQRTQRPEGLDAQVYQYILDQNLYISTEEPRD